MHGIAMAYKLALPFGSCVACCIQAAGSTVGMKPQEEGRGWGGAPKPARLCRQQEMQCIWSGMCLKAEV